MIVKPSKVTRTIAALDERAIVRRETAISIVVNMAFSAAFFVFAFGTSALPMPEALGRDCIPQAFMVALMGSLIPGLLVRRRVRAKGTAGVILWAILAAAFACAFAGGGAWWLSRSIAARIDYISALAMKIAFGGVIAAIATPVALHRVLIAPRAS